MDMRTSADVEAPSPNCRLRSAAQLSIPVHHLEPWLAAAPALTANSHLLTTSDVAVPLDQFPTRWLRTGLQMAWSHFNKGGEGEGKGAKEGEGEGEGGKDAKEKKQKKGKKTRKAD